MNSSLPPPLDPDPYRAPDTDAAQSAAVQGKSAGSVGKGIAVFFASLLIGAFPLTALVTGIWGGMGLLRTQLGASPLLVPLLAPIVAGIWLWRRGERRSVRGMWIGLAILVGLVGLLVAACFGLLAGSLRNIH